MATITLPAGHQWVERNFVSGAETIFDCPNCGATFEHDGMDGSFRYEPGDESCDEDADNGD